MKWRVSAYVILDAGFGIWSLTWVIANALWWHSLANGTCAGILLGWSGATLMYRGFMAYWKRSAEFWKRHCAISMSFADEWREIVRVSNPVAFEQAMRLQRERAEALKRMN